MKFEANIATVPVAIDTDTLPAESLTFVLEYGLRQYIQDGAAVSKTFASGDRKGEVKTDDEIAAEKIEGVTERVANLMSGEFTRRGPAAPRLSPEEKERQAIIMDGLAKWAKSQDKSLPTRTGKKANPELLDKLVAAWYAKNQAVIDKEVARRMKEAAKAEPVDTTELDALLG